MHHVGLSPYASDLVALAAQGLLDAYGQEAMDDLSRKLLRENAGGRALWHRGCRLARSSAWRAARQPVSLLLYGVEQATQLFQAVMRLLWQGAVHRCS